MHSPSNHSPRTLSKALTLRALAVASLLSGFSSARADLSEGFDDITTLAGSGWVLQNNSSPVGVTGWFQGNGATFPAQTGAADSYIAANFNNAAFGGDISNWLISPTLSLNNGDTIGFYTRTPSPQLVPDRLELRVSLNGASTDVGATSASVGDFTTLLLTVNAPLNLAGYPDNWTFFGATISGLGGPTSGRFAFRYEVPDTSANADFIGIDTVTYTSTVPEAAPWSAGVMLGLASLWLYRQRSRRHQVVDQKSNG